MLVVGTGLLGTSIGLALRRHDATVWLSDVSPEHVRTASGLGAGVAAPEDGTPALVVVAVPPDLLGPEIARALVAHPEAVVTDVGSVKSAPLEELAERTGADELLSSASTHDRDALLASDAMLRELLA